MSEHFVRFDGMVWPNPDALIDVAWALRYGNPSRTDNLVAAAVISAYLQLVSDTQKARNEKVRGIREASIASRAVLQRPTSASGKAA